MKVRRGTYFFPFLNLVAFLTAVRIALSSTFVSADNYGTATYYTPPYVPSACYGDEDNDVLIAAAGDEIWQGGAACGSFYSVTCTGGGYGACTGSGNVVVKIVDYCPKGCVATIGLSLEAFSSIADPNAGTISISYHKVQSSLG